MINNNNDNVWKMFDLLFTDFGSAFSVENADDTKNCFYSSKNFPPVNVFIDEKTKDLSFEFALAGYSKEDMKISFEGDRMTLEVKPTAKEKTSKKILKKGIKLPYINNSFIVPSSKYHTESAVAKVNNGLLEIHIEAMEDQKPKELKIT